MEKQAIIYARVSSLGTRQDTERQIIDLQKYAERNDYNVVKIVEEHVSGAKYAKEREFNTAFEFAKENQCIILVSELSRIGRNCADVMKTLQNCIDAKVNVYIQKEDLFLLDKDGNQRSNAKIMLFALSVVAEFERENISYRLNSGLQRYKDNGGKVGRKQGYKESKDTLLSKPGYEKAVKLIRAGRSYSSIIAELKGQDTPVKITKPTLIKLNNLFVRNK